MSRRVSAAIVSLAALVVVAAACDTGDGRTMRPPTEAERLAMPTTTTTVPPVRDPTAANDTLVPGAGSTPASTAPTTTAQAAAAAFALTLPWADGSPIPVVYTCDGNNTSPALSWTAPPAGTVELALVLTDDDADGFVHWAVAGIPPSAGQVAAGTAIAGATEGKNDFGDTGYGGPCPPKGSPHRYRFLLYALDQQAELPADFTGKDLERAAGPAAMTIAQASGTYTKAP